MHATRLGQFFAVWVLLAAGVFARAPGASAQPGSVPLRIGLTPVFLDHRVAFLQRWRTYLSAQLGRPVEFVQRQTYREVTELVTSGEIDAAWLCGFPYVRHSSELRLLAVPLFEGEPLYRSYLIVPAGDHATRSIEDLRGRVFAYSDPDSNSGYLVPRVQLLEAGQDPERFFRRSFFAWSHRDVVVAVADGLAEGGAVDGYVWETLRRQHPELTGRTRVVHRSKPYGFPPFVVRKSLAQADVKALRAVLLAMARDPAGAVLLRELNLDGFVAGSPDLFDGIRRAVRRVEGG